MQTPTILFVEGHQDSLNALTTLLERRNYRVVTAITYKQALSVANDVDIDLLLCDIDLTPDHGTALLQRLRGHHPTPAIATSSYCTNLRVQRMMEVGFDECLPKPLLWNKLDECIHDLLDIRRH